MGSSAAHLVAKLMDWKGRLAFSHSKNITNNMNSFYYSHCSPTVWRMCRLSGVLCVCVVPACSLGSWGRWAEFDLKGRSQRKWPCAASGCTGCGGAEPGWQPPEESASAAGNGGETMKLEGKREWACSYTWNTRCLTSEGWSMISTYNERDQRNVLCLWNIDSWEYKSLSNSCVSSKCLIM